jgi:hypothetical protein
VRSGSSGRTTTATSRNFSVAKTSSFDALAITECSDGLMESSSVATTAMDATAMNLRSAGLDDALAERERPEREGEQEGDLAGQPAGAVLPHVVQEADHQEAGHREQAHGQGHHAPAWRERSIALAPMSATSGWVRAPPRRLSASFPVADCCRSMPMSRPAARATPSETKGS